MVASHGVRTNLAPADWTAHRFGIPAARWESLRDNAVWVTGAGTGYGRSVTVALALAGARVFASGRRETLLEETRREAVTLGADETRVVPFPMDIRNDESVSEAVKRMSMQLGHLHGLVHCAALPQPRPGQWPMTELEPDRWRALLETNVTGQWLVARAALPLLSAGTGFRMLFFTSEAGWANTPGFGPYNTSKAALNNLGASFAAECAKRYPEQDVQVNVLVPGEARTEMNQGSTDSPYAVAAMTLLLLSHPPSGPNGRFFHRDGRHLTFGYASPYERSLLDGSVLSSAAHATQETLRPPGIGQWLRHIARAINR